MAVTYSSGQDGTIASSLIAGVHETIFLRRAICDGWLWSHAKSADTAAWN
jgi:hypothetical protein